MTPEQALDVLNQMVARAPATRADHVVAQQALDVLGGVVERVSGADQGSAPPSA